MTMAAGIDVGTAAVKAVLFRPSETRRSDGGVSVHRKGQHVQRVQHRWIAMPSPTVIKLTDDGFFAYAARDRAFNASRSQK